ncbi:hypothetical protein D8674_014088 [Pyrus ussuriensis x Pyrus communis]|uniref:Uncharacterized protein n=1 Tax=Pyrus ussuriensis x Pyrus communis TaxID=2448454 RepID=A0A5N5GRK3_9ROSA|nr:hypothetical protein D8674_014088 [Pyrus ussuriensis x Pyrus communis]
MAVSFASIVPVRSISLPSRLNPKSQKIESDLNKLKTSKFSSSLVSEDLLVGLSGLAEFFRTVHTATSLPRDGQHALILVGVCHVLSPVTQQALRHQQCKAIVEEALDGSIGLLDSCGSAKDILLTMNEHVQNIQSALRRRTGDSSIETTKKMETNLGSFHLLDCDHGVLIVLKLLRELSDVTISIFQSLFVFPSTQVASTTGSKWSLVSTLMAAKFAATEKGQTVYNELGIVDVALCSLHGNIRRNTLDCSISSLDAGLEIFFRFAIECL